MSFYYKTENVESKKGFCLGYSKERKDEHDILIKVAPELGDNLYCFRIDSFEVVHHDSFFSIKSYYTGNPILYPFPNRLRNCRYSFDGKGYWQQKNGIPVFLHSLVYDEAWSFDEPHVTEDSVVLKTWIHVDRDHPIYEGYPFEHTIGIDFIVTRKGFDIQYQVENNDDKRLPFGISFHTFFKKLCGDDGSFIRVPAKHMMELDDALLPTGKLLNVEGKAYDLRTPKASSQLDLDNCFTSMIDGERVYIDYPALGLRVYMDATKEFTHMQVYTPKNRPFFCVERQTCSTDAVNLDAKGLKKESHLLTVDSCKKMSGKVMFSFELT